METSNAYIISLRLAFLSVLSALDLLRAALLVLIDEILKFDMKDCNECIHSIVVDDSTSNKSSSPVRDQVDQDPQLAINIVPIDLNQHNKKDDVLHDSDTDCSSEWDFLDDESLFNTNPLDKENEAIHVRILSSLTVSDYLCPCRECPKYYTIQKHVMQSCIPLSSKQSVCSLLQAFSTYNEVVGFRPNMIPKAFQCLLKCHGDIDAAFNVFIDLYDFV